jgi:GxxExxY protein
MAIYSRNEPMQIAQIFPEFSSALICVICGLPMEKDQQSYAIIGAAMEVHRQLGHGFLEPVYQEAFALELTERGIPFQREVILPIAYKGQKLTCSYKADFVCYDSLLVELKALGKLFGIEEAQVINYLKATGFSRSLLLNFGAPSLEYKRLVFTHSKNLRESAQSADVLRRTP